MPESCRILGVAIAPAVRMISRRALIVDRRRAARRRPPALEEHLCTLLSVRMVEIGAAFRLAQEGLGGAPAASAACGGLVEADALLPAR